MRLVEIGSLLGGRYRLVELLGRGGMATIYRGRDTQLGRDVAVKVLRPEFGRDEDFLARFHNEAQAVAQLNHPNVVAVYDIGEDPAGPFIVMEYVEGEDLATLLRRNGPLGPRQAARIAAEVAHALDAAHARGIVHRDVKPANVLIAADGRVKVTDFGIARAVTDAQLTLPGTTMGSVHYLAPEQVRGLGATSASDVYALGIVLYEMLVGHRPWEGDTAAAVAMGRLGGPVPGPSDRIAVPPEIDAIVRRALAKEPDDRFPSAGAMAATLETLLATTGVRGSSVASAAAPLDGQALQSVQAQAEPSAEPVKASVAQVVTPEALGSATPEASRSAAPTTARPAGPGRVAQARRIAEPGISGVVEPDGQTPVPPGRTSAWTWLAGIAGLLVLVAAGYLIFRFMTGLTAAPSGAVPVPNFVGQTLDDARTTAESLGLSLDASPQETTGKPVGTIVSQDPPVGTQVDRGSTVMVVVATGSTTVAVPDIRGKSEADALAALFGAGLANGTAGHQYDQTVPAGDVVSQGVAPGTQVAKGTPIDYVVSQGPQPSPTASPSPSSSASPSPTPSPTPSTPATPEPIAVGDYRCISLDQANEVLTSEGFVLGAVVTNPTGQAYDGTWLVQAQLPSPGELRPPGTAIRFTVISPTSACP